VKESNDKLSNKQLTLQPNPYKEMRDSSRFVSCRASVAVRLEEKNMSTNLNCQATY